MKLLIVTPIFPPDIGGPATYTKELINKLPKTIQTKVITLIPKKSAFTRQLSLFRDLFNQLNSTDLVYLQGTITVGLMTLIACILKRKKYILKYVGDEAWEKYKRLGGKQNLEKYLSTHKTSLSFLLNKLILKKAKTIIVPSQYLQEILHKYYSVRSVVIPNAIEKKYKNKISKKSNQLIFVGRLVPWKNVDKIIKSIQYLSKNWNLIIIGTGPELYNLKDTVKQFMLENRINFKGKLDQKETHRLIAQSAGLILYSSYEGLPHVILEAFIYKTKVFASNIRPHQLLLKNSKFGCLVKTSNPKQLARIISKKYPKNKLEMAYNEVVNHYHWPNHINKLTKIFYGN